MIARQLSRALSQLGQYHWNDVGPSTIAHLGLASQAAPCVKAGSMHQYVLLALPPTWAELFQQHIGGRASIRARLIHRGCRRGGRAVCAAGPLAAAGGARLGDGASCGLQGRLLQRIADLLEVEKTGGKNCWSFEDSKRGRWSHGSRRDAGSGWVINPGLAGRAA